MAQDKPVMARVQTIHTLSSEAGSIFQRVRPKLAVYSHIILVGVSTEDLVKQTRASTAGRSSSAKT